MTGELKRIGFVKTYAATATNMAGSAYATAKTFVPKQLAGTVESTEALVVSKATPIASWAIGKGEAVLGMVDAQVRLTTASLRGGSLWLRRPGVKRSLSFGKQTEGARQRRVSVSPVARGQETHAHDPRAQSLRRVPALVLLALSARDDRPRALRGPRRKL